jgi:hypothetical protein
MTSTWRGADCRDYQILSVENDWVFYKNIKTDQEYSCLVEAFLERFREVTNG